MYPQYISLDLTFEVEQSILNKFGVQSLNLIAVLVNETVYPAYINISAKTDEQREQFVQSQNYKSLEGFFVNCSSFPLNNQKFESLDEIDEEIETLDEIYNIVDELVENCYF